MPGKFISRFSDYNGESSSVTLPCTTITAANFDAQDLARSLLQDSLEAITLGQPTVSSHGNEAQVVAPGTPSDNHAAQRELKWLVRYHVVISGAKRRVEIPCPDTSLLSTTDRGFLNLDSGAGLDFKSNFEAFVKEYPGLSVAIDSVQLVGRNL